MYVSGLFSFLNANTCQSLLSSVIYSDSGFIEFVIGRAVSVYTTHQLLISGGHKLTRPNVKLLFSTGKNVIYFLHKISSYNSD